MHEGTQPCKSAYVHIDAHAMRWARAYLQWNQLKACNTAGALSHQCPQRTGYEQMTHAYQHWNQLEACNTATALLHKCAQYSWCAQMLAHAAYL